MIRLNFWLALNVATCRARRTPRLQDLAFGPCGLSEPPGGFHNRCERTNDMTLCCVRASTIVCGLSSAYIMCWIRRGSVKPQLAVLCCRLSSPAESSHCAWLTMLTNFTISCALTLPPRANSRWVFLRCSCVFFFFFFFFF